jgi:ABC-type multidrug transport system ATPase subunit
MFGRRYEPPFFFLGGFEQNWSAFVLHPVDQNQIISVNHLAKTFGAFEAVKDVSFTVRRGEVFGFLGPNGAGKSTTMRCMLSLIKPTAGDIQLFGMALSSHRTAILRNVGSIIEKPDFYKYLSAEKNLAIFGRISGASITKRDIYEMLNFVGLSGRERDKVGGFSHGMRQRLGIAQALLHKPELIVLDEPTTGLDPQGIIDVRDLIMRLRDEQGKTVVLSSHQLSEIEIIANRMVIIQNGKNVVEGAVNELLNQEELVVRFETNDGPRTAACLRQGQFSATVLEVEAQSVSCHADRSMIPAITKALVDEQIEVYAIASKRRLEDYFIKMIRQ